MTSKDQKDQKDHKEKKEQAVEQCLQQMDALARELEQAMSAIAGNSPDALEQSIRQQQGSVGELAAALDRARKAGEAEHAPLAVNLAGAGPAKANLDSRIGKAARKLCGLNEQYAALLEHSGRSMRMLKALYGQTPVLENRSRSDAGILDRYQTWSWEG